MPPSANRQFVGGDVLQPEPLYELCRRLREREPGLIGRGDPVLLFCLLLLHRCDVTQWSLAWAIFALAFCSIATINRRSLYGLRHAIMKEDGRDFRRNQLSRRHCRGGLCRDLCSATWRNVGPDGRARQTSGALLAPFPAPFLGNVLAVFGYLIMAFTLAGLLGHLGPGQVTLGNGIVSGRLCGSALSSPRWPSITAPPAVHGGASCSTPGVG